jgi:hypothetical protein
MSQRAVSAPGSRQLSPTRSSHSIRNGHSSQLDATFTPVVDPTEHPALNAGGAAVITGAASGIGFAAAQQLAG